MEEGIKRTYYITDKLDMALKIRAVQDHMTYSEVVTAALERYLKSGTHDAADFGSRHFLFTAGRSD